MARLWIFRPLDTLFFRDGSPYNAGESSQMGVASLFPPAMTTLQGAVRALLARQQGWREIDGPATWPPELGGPDDLGQLILRGPYLRKDGEWLFPVPAHVLRRGEGGPLVRLEPGPEAVMTDIASHPVRLPRPVEHPRDPDAEGGLKALDQHWVTAAGLQAVLAGGIPPGVISTRELWQPEPRVGIRRERATRTVGEGQLYSSVHVRLRPKVELAVLVDGPPAQWSPDTPVAIPLGGESRMAEVEVISGPDPIPPCPTLTPTGGVLRFTVTLLTPGLYSEREALQVVREGPPGIPGAVVSACIPRLQQWGGWDLRNREPRPLRPVIPAGATWFYEAGPDAAPRVQDLHGRCLGPYAQYGFGQIAIGRWEECV